VVLKAEGRTDMKEIIKKWYNALDFSSKYNEQFYRILETEKLDSEMTIEQYDLNSQNGRKNFLMYLYFIENLEKQYINRGIPQEIFYDTIQDIVRWTDVWSEIKGELWLEELVWLSFHLSFKLFKVGRLQFHMTTSGQDIPEYGILSKDCVLAVHIPPTEPFTPQKCEESFCNAEVFFEKYFPDFSYSYFTCRSWMLDDTLVKYLKPNSNILQFQKNFMRINRNESYNILKHVFKWDTRKENLLDFESKTQFAEQIKKAVLDGEKFYSTLGIKKRVNYVENA